MNHGFSIVEVLVAAAIGIGVLSIVIVNIAHSSTLSEKVVSHQQTLESLFHTVDTIKSDLSRCGMRMQEAARKFPVHSFQNESRGFTLRYGVSNCRILEEAPKGSKIITIPGDDFARKRKLVLLYSLAEDVFEINEIQSVSGNRIQLKNPMENNYPESSELVILKEIRLRYYPRTSQLKRKLDLGYYQPLIENVTDFSSTYFPESHSLLYRLEVNRREQVRGYVFLPNLVEP